jgi:AmmeMemoRadiSam system protein A
MIDAADVTRHGPLVVDLALDAIASVLRGGAVALPDLDALPGELREDGASFVTLERDGGLLGCIGTLRAEQPLGVDVALHGVAAAFSDPRLPAIRDDDFRHMSVKVSVVSPLEPMDVTSSDELVAALEPGRTGLLVEARRGGATFLPSVWSHVSGREEFLHLLWRKAGWRPGTWPDGIRASRYTTVEVGNPGPRAFATTS